MKKYENFSMYAKEKYKNFFYYFFLTVYYIDHVISCHYTANEFFIKKPENLEKIDLTCFDKIQKNLIEFAKTIKEEDFFGICEKFQEYIERLKAKEKVFVTDFFLLPIKTFIKICMNLKIIAKQVYWQKKL